MIGGSAVVLIGASLLLWRSLDKQTDPEDKLPCASDKRMQSTVSYEGDPVETRSPSELATAWRADSVGQPNPSLVNQVIYSPSDTVTKVGYADGEGRMVMVLNYEWRAKGWRLTTISQCG